MEKSLADLIVKSIQKVAGKRTHQFHEPLFFGKEKKYFNFKSNYTISYGIEELIKNFHLFKKKNKKIIWEL